MLTVGCADGPPKEPRFSEDNESALRSVPSTYVLGEILELADIEEMRSAAQVFRGLPTYAAPPELSAKLHAWLRGDEDPN